ncbi:MAG TPA: YciC family protein [Xanthomonadales bacterium]|nr:YciC family protein [Xanthomonadales bacterium]
MASNAKSFSKKEAIKFGWNTTLKNFWLFLGITGVVYGVQFLPNLFSGYMEEQELLFGMVNLVLSIASLGLTLGSLKIYLDFVDRKKPQFSDLFSLYNAKMMWRLFAASFIYGIVVLLGLLLLIIPGIYFAIKYGLYCYFIVDKNSGVFESISQSGKITRGHVWNLLAFGLLLFLIAVAGFLALGVGLLVALPAISLAEAFVYRKLSGASKTK